MVLYLGTHLPRLFRIRGAIHYPVIRTVPIPISGVIWQEWDRYTHLIFTSKNGVSIFFAQWSRAFPQVCQDVSWCGKKVLAIGQATAERLRQCSIEPHSIPEEESQEGMIQLLDSMALPAAYVLYPRSILARLELESFLIRRQIHCRVVDLYKTIFQKLHPIPDLSTIQEIVFTSPTTVRAFIQIYGSLPIDKKLTSIGPVTEKEVKKHLGCYSA